MMESILYSAYCYLCVSRGYVAVKVFYQEADQVSAIGQILAAPSDWVTTEGNCVTLIKGYSCYLAAAIQVHPAPAYRKGIPNFRGDFGSGARSRAADITIDLEEALTFKEQLGLARFASR